MNPLIQLQTKTSPPTNSINPLFLWCGLVLTLTHTANGRLILSVWENFLELRPEFPGMGSE